MLTSDLIEANPGEQGVSEQLSTITVGQSRLEGEVFVSGAKNSVLRLMAATLLTGQRVVIRNYPAGLLDAIVHAGMLDEIGKSCRVEGSTLVVEEARPLSSRLDWRGRSIRNTLLVLGALTARTGAGAVPLPGGCDLGDRKYDLHELVLRSLGAEVWTEGGMLCAQAPSGGLTGAHIHLPIRSTGATENALLCGSLAKGETVVWNPHVRPEVLDLVKLLRTMGAEIDVFGQESIRVKGAPELGGAQHTTISDNMEALTWLIGATVTGGDVTIHNFPLADLEVPLIFLRGSGAKFYLGNDSVIVRGGCAYPVEISTGPFPGINSDMQPLFAVYGACARGKSTIVDLRFPDRYGYREEFAKIGVSSRVANGALLVEGGAALEGARVRALDLRCGIALTLLGLVARGETVVEDAWQVERGYNDIVGKLRTLGAKVSAS
ncbi:UDP-N-acetylglucosamine 1-carboxyvinyltransferase [Methylosinus sp. PW1]|uniref:UDP-N-acetylglucosamine 1-carboxyvinyltransferase n=1 Tax=Methylosinus sp. PW1 TaxID=107636 RepID=UPI00068C85B7|nr:UDP-N-acetylglucosamine 1-carboxyvinyltransferase [Methylosinus sp. PW1]